MYNSRMCQHLQSVQCCQNRLVLPTKNASTPGVSATVKLKLTVVVFN